MSVWLSHHWHAFVLSLKRLAAAPVGSVLSILVIGVAFSLPAGIHMLLGNIQTLSAHIASMPQLSLFLRVDAGDEESAQIGVRLREHPQVASFEFIPRDRALEQLKQESGLAGLMEGLERNPLPDAFVVNAASPLPAVLEALRTELQAWPGVEHAQLDSAWASRLDALLNLGRLAVLMLSILLGFALIAVTFNTIRLQILTRRDEIEVSKLIGATAGFIRRPFLYFGALQGVAGGLAAWFILLLGIRLLDTELRKLAQLYGVDFSLHHLSMEESLILLLVSACLGWIGAWLSVASHLWRIEPY
ncbi:permease-like cell division protein FtsX [Nitrosovibrio sp. Nv17]|jgi:cell division transport system permease protein|uniref:permease-like cell division protein FtsX n=1 Tax=Nitrosovibrio sp. Nv17 TaxID=1855339 RepID=UPI000908E92B|nr:permease-like cell division protein FtsX [Nitrosovibrio sp. Nv17]SFW31327.1 cell division protein FtsX [Nitrosovibrio sp. Nv17]